MWSKMTINKHTIDSMLFFPPFFYDVKIIKDYLKFFPLLSLYLSLLFLSLFFIRDKKKCGKDVKINF